MPFITVQLGQCGNQLGCSLFQTLANELSSGDHGKAEIEEFFRPINNGDSSMHAGNMLDVCMPGKKYVARSVLIDMEPKVVNAARNTAAASDSWWAYPAKGYLCMNSGAGNNWAHGFHGYGPSVHDAALELVRKEAEACDLMGGFVLLQSMAGGTGAGLGTYVAQALRDEYHSSHIVNCCVWPYESGEVIVQSYNTLLTLSHLTQLSDGIVTMENEALHRVCTRLYNIPRPSFNDMNAVAARSLASILLPSYHRPSSNTSSLGGSSTATPGGSAASAGKGQRGGRPSPGATSSNSVAERLAALRMNGTPGSSNAGSVAGAPGSVPALGPLQYRPSHQPFSILSDVVTHLCSHPLYRVLTLRSLPQVPPSSVDFTTFTWPAILKRLRQMMITGSVLEEGMDWGVTTAGACSSSPAAAGVAGSPGLPAGCGGRSINRSLANWLVLRGQSSGDVDVSDYFCDHALHPSWAVDPLAVSHHPAKFTKCAMSAALLSNDQSCVAPMGRMLDRAYSMLASRAFVHQYEKYGHTVQDFRECFAHVEEIMERYRCL